MEKLIELLNEYEDTDNWENGYQVRFRESKIISKKFGFIKWLVENDKIDKEKIIRAETIPLKDVNEDYLLMMLAIQEQPIEVLVSILK